MFALPLPGCRTCCLFIQRLTGGARVTPVGDIEIEIVFRIALRGRTSDLAHLLQAMNRAEAVVIGIVEEPAPAEEQCQEGVTTTVRGLSE
jgi:hypothetical protein